MSVTKREAAIISAYTGILFGEFSEMHKYVEELFCEPVFIHQFGSKEFATKVKEMSKADFLLINESIGE